MPLQDAVSMLKRHEGFRHVPYRDSRGVWSIGYGFALTGGLTEHEATLILESRVKKLRRRLPISIGFWHDLSIARQEVLVCMAYNLGVSGLLKFKKMLTALQIHDYKQAAAEMLDSLWALQVGDEPGQRAYDLSRLMSTG